MLIVSIASTFNYFIEPSTNIDNLHFIHRSQQSVNQSNTKYKVFNEFILFLRTYNGLKDIFDDIFFDTFKFFWPFHVIQANLLIVLDDERPNDHQYKQYLINKFENELSEQIKLNKFNYYITFESPNSSVYNEHGHNRQQWSMMWCDKFLAKLNISDKYKYVGFVDTDTMFTSIITPNAIFNDANNMDNPKPVSIVYVGESNGWWGNTEHNTVKWFGKPPYFRAMTM